MRNKETNQKRKITGKRRRRRARTCIYEGIISPPKRNRLQPNTQSSIKKKKKANWLEKWGNEDGKKKKNRKLAKRESG